MIDKFDVDQEPVSVPVPISTSPSPVVQVKPIVTPITSINPIKPIVPIVPTSPTKPIKATENTIESNLSECERCKLNLSPIPTDKWMIIKMPQKSYFNFDIVTNVSKWKESACSAACGEQVLLKQILKQFPENKDFLPGDNSAFAQWQPYINIFMDKINSFQPLLRDKSKFVPLPKSEQIISKSEAELIKTLIPPPGSIYQETDKFYPIITAGFPFIKLGSKSNSTSYFQGEPVGNGYYTSLRKFLSMWKANKDNIKTPYVVMYINNENWGWLSTYYPNRTAPWEFDEDGMQAQVYEFLNHPMTVALITNQHHNYSHSKIIPMPLGLAGNPEVTGDLYTAMKRSVLNETKTNLLLSSSSDWGPRE